jgi:O-antigen ligase
LGNAGFFFIEKMPAYGWALWETGQIFNHLSFIPNVKSMWMRLLAETGIIGFALFLTWAYVLWRAAQAARASREPTIRTIALAGQIVLLAYLVEGFSLDSFALPYLWVSLGILTAAADLHHLLLMQVNGKTARDTNLKPFPSNQSRSMDVT